MQGWTRAYVTELKKSGRVVMSPDGRSVDVQATRALIAQTSSPDKVGVAARHAAERLQRSGDDDYGDEDAVAGASRPEYHAARARREEANATRAEIDLAKEAGQLVEAAAVGAVIADAVTNLRASLEGLGAILAPQLAAESDPREVRLLVDDAVREALGDLAARFADIAKGAH